MKLCSDLQWMQVMQCFQFVCEQGFQVDGILGHQGLGRVHLGVALMSTYTYRTSIATYMSIHGNNELWDTLKQ